MRRRGVTGRRRGPGLVGTVGRTAVIAGTATAVSQGVSGATNANAQQQAARAQQQAAQAQQQLDEAAQRAVAAQQAQVPQAAPAPAAAAGPDRITQLQQLAELKQQGILTDEEFDSEKARILGS